MTCKQTEELRESLSLLLHTEADTATLRRAPVGLTVLSLAVCLADKVLLEISGMIYTQHFCEFAFMMKKFDNSSDFSCFVVSTCCLDFLRIFFRKQVRRNLLMEMIVMPDVYQLPRPALHCYYCATSHLTLQVLTWCG